MFVKGRRRRKRRRNNRHTCIIYIALDLSSFPFAFLFVCFEIRHQSLYMNINHTLSLPPSPHQSKRRKWVEEKRWKNKNETIKKPTIWKCILIKSLLCLCICVFFYSIGFKEVFFLSYSKGRSRSEMMKSGIIIIFLFLKNTHGETRV